MMKYILEVLLACSSHFFFYARAQEVFFEKEIDSLISVYVDRGQFNGSILLALDGEKVYHKAWGYADLETKSLLDSHSQYEMASISKIFTSSAIFILEEAGKLGMDDQLSSYLPELPVCFRPVRIHHLLSHTAGIPKQAGDWRSLLNTDNSDVMQFLLEQEQLEFRPGTKYRYSNNGFVLLALVVERVSGQPFEQFVMQKLFKEVGMDHSFVRSRNLSVNTADLVKSYVHGKQADWPLYRVGPGGIYSTVEDLFLWDQAFFSYKIFDQSTVHRILSPVQVAGKDQPYGLGWGILHLEGKSYAGHTGGMFGFRTLYEHQIQENNTLILLTNIGDLTPLMEIRNKLAEAMRRQGH
jgi:CubicO group peptidase (beta-lactamase class C family)